MANMNAKASAAPAVARPFLADPTVGTVCTVASGLSFLLVCMLLPLVGKSGTVTMHARENFQAFLAAVLLSLILAALATFAKMERRKLDGSPKPVFSIVLCALSGFLLLALLAGILRV